MNNPSPEAQRHLELAVLNATRPDDAVPLLIQALKEGADLNAPLSGGVDSMTALLDVCCNEKAAMAKALVLCGYNPLPAALHQAVVEESYTVALALIQGCHRAGCRGPQGENALEVLLRGPSMSPVEDLVNACEAMGMNQDAPVTASSWEELLSLQGLGKPAGSSISNQLQEFSEAVSRHSGPKIRPW